MRVLLATSWGDQPCGIKSHSELLIESVHAADQGITMIPSAAALDPNWVFTEGFLDINLIVLNYHRALHSRWTPQQVERMRQSGPTPVVIIFHDTFGELPPDQLSIDLCATADAFIVHEPCQGLDKALYWRMGVPEVRGEGFPAAYSDVRPILGTLGFDFGWKNYDKLAEITAEVGWGFTIVCPEMSTEREDDLRRKNPWLEVHKGWNTTLAVNYLRGCDATAFMYTCGNSGQSGAILQGIAARKPVYALRACRQFRSLYTAEDRVWQSLRWLDDFGDLRERLLGDPLTRLDPLVVRLADADRWPKLGQKYATLFRHLQGT